MALSPRRSTTAINADANAVAPLLNSGTIKIYDGSQPGVADCAVSTQTLLATLSFASTAFSTASSGVATANTITSGTAAATSTASWFRALKSDGTTVVFDGSVGTAAADLVLNTVSIVSGATVSVTSFTYTACRG